MSREKEKLGYLKWIDVARGMAILCVVLAHTLSLYSISAVKYLSGWEVMFFFFITGYLLKEKQEQFGNFIAKMLKGYVRPYFILCGINLLIVSLKDLIVSQLSLKNIAIHCLGIIYCHPSYMPNCTPLWFLTCIFIVRVILFFLLKKKIAVQIVCILSCLIVGSIICIFNIPRLPWCMGPAFFSVIFCYLGFLIKKYHLLEILVNRIFLKTLCIVAFLSGGFYAIYCNPVRVLLQTMHVGNIGLMLVGAVFCSCGLLLVCEQMGNYNNIINEILSWFGKHTIFIMGFDFASREIVRKLVSFLSIDTLLTAILSFSIRVVFLTIWCIIWNTVVKLVKNQEIQKALTF